jgi:hypothetical protein
LRIRAIFNATTEDDIPRGSFFSQLPAFAFSFGDPFSVQDDLQM